MGVPTALQEDCILLERADSGNMQRKADHHETKVQEG